MVWNPEALGSYNFNYIGTRHPLCYCRADGVEHFYDTGLLRLPFVCWTRSLAFEADVQKIYDLRLANCAQRIAP
jgi:hypothetical protein